MQFSVIIPTHNRSEKLKRALDSVIAQSEQALEIIVVDDASGPEELRKTQEVVAATHGARLIALKDNVRAAKARNIGAAEAQGDWIALLDSDDWWAPTRLASHAATIRADDDVVMTYDSAWVVQTTAEEATGTVGRPAPEKWRFEVALAAWNFIGGCSAVCLKKSIFEALGGFDDSMPSCQDWELWMRMAGQGKVAFTSKAETYFDIGPHDRISTTNTSVKSGHDRFHATCMQVPQTAAETRYVQAEHMCTMAEIERRFDNPGLALRLMTRALLTRPSMRISKRMAALLMGMAKGSRGLA